MVVGGFEREKMHPYISSGDCLTPSVSCHALMHHPHPAPSAEYKYQSATRTWGRFATRTPSESRFGRLTELKSDHYSGGKERVLSKARSDGSVYCIRLGVDLFPIRHALLREGTRS